MTFDPFLYLALPLPAPKSCFNVTLFLSYQSSAAPPLAVNVSLWLDPNQRVEYLKQELKRVCADRLTSSDSELELFQSRDGVIKRWLVDPQPLNPILNSPNETCLMAFETSLCITEEPLVHIAVIQVETRFL